MDSMYCNCFISIGCIILYLKLYVYIFLFWRKFIFYIFNDYKWYIMKFFRIMYMYIIDIGGDFLVSINLIKIINEL